MLNYTTLIFLTVTFGTMAILVGSSSNAFAQNRVVNPVVVIVSDVATSPNTRISSLQQISNQAFHDFIEEILMHLKSIGTVVRFSDSLPHFQQISSLHFVRIPVTNSVRSFVSRSSADSFEGANCTHENPWLEFTSSVDREGKSVIRGTIYWNERQLLHDKAVLAGLAVGGGAPSESLTYSAYERWSQSYANRVISTQRPEPNEKLLSLGIPVDLLWLFRHSPQTTFMPFSSVALQYMQSVAEDASHEKARSIVSIIGECYADPIR